MSTRNKRKAEPKSTPTPISKRTRNTPTKPTYEDPLTSDSEVDATPPLPVKTVDRQVGLKLWNDAVAKREQREKFNVRLEAPDEAIENDEEESDSEVDDDIDDHFNPNYRLIPETTNAAYKAMKEKAEAFIRGMKEKDPIIGVIADLLHSNPFESPEDKLHLYGIVYAGCVIMDSLKQTSQANERIAKTLERIADELILNPDSDSKSMKEVKAHFETTKTTQEVKSTEGSNEKKD